MLLTKPQIVASLENLVKRQGGDLQNVGGDCYALCVSGEIRIAVAVKETTKQGKRIWIGLPMPIVELVTGFRVLRDYATPSAYRAFIAVSHVRFKTLLVIPIVPVAEDLSRRASADRVPFRHDFDVRMTGLKKYVIKGEEFRGDVPLKIIDTFAPIEAILGWTRKEFEERE